MPDIVSEPPALPVWDCHICGAPAAFQGHPERCASIPTHSGRTHHGLYHDDGTLCRWIEHPDGTIEPLAIQLRWVTA